VLALLLLLLRVLSQEGVVCVALDWVIGVEGGAVILVEGSINGDALGQVRGGDEVAPCSGTGGSMGTEPSAVSAATSARLVQSAGFSFPSSYTLPMASSPHPV
jgi:hypothetical protein